MEQQTSRAQPPSPFEAVNSSDNKVDHPNPFILVENGNYISALTFIRAQQQLICKLQADLDIALRELMHRDVLNENAEIEERNRVATLVAKKILTAMQQIDAGIRMSFGGQELNDILDHYRKKTGLLP